MFQEAQQLPAFQPKASVKHWQYFSQSTQKLSVFVLCGISKELKICPWGHCSTLSLLRNHWISVFLKIKTNVKTTKLPIYSDKTLSRNISYVIQMAYLTTTETDDNLIWFKLVRPMFFLGSPSLKEWVKHPITESYFLLHWFKYVELSDIKGLCLLISLTLN